MKKILIVGSDYYKEIYNGLLKSAKSRLSTNYIIDELLVPGVFEIPVTIAKKIKDYDGFLALGCVIKGKTLISILFSGNYKCNYELISRKQKTNR